MAKKPAPFVAPEGSVEFTAPRTGRAIVLHELNGLEMANADSAAGSQLAVPSYRAAFSILAINGVKELPLENDVDVEALLQSLSASELNRTMRTYQEWFSMPPVVPPTEEELAENPRAKGKPWKQPDPKRNEDGTADVRAFTGRTFTLRELNGLQQAIADRAAGNPLTAYHYRCAAAVTAINGDKEPLATTPEALRKRLESLRGSELETIMDANAQLFVLTDEELGNESTPTDSLQS